MAIGDTFGALPTVSRSGYKFDGWYNAATGGAKISSNDKFSGTYTTFYARWTANAPPPPETKTLTFNSNGGSAPNPASRQLKVGDRIGTLPTVTRSGYTFDGWYTAASGGTKLTADHSYSGSYTTVYAQWKKQ